MNQLNKIFPFLAGNKLNKIFPILPRDKFNKSPDVLIRAFNQGFYHDLSNLKSYLLEGKPESKPCIYGVFRSGNVTPLVDFIKSDQTVKWGSYMHSQLGIEYKPDTFAYVLECCTEHHNSNLTLTNFVLDYLGPNDASYYKDFIASYITNHCRIDSQAQAIIRIIKFIAKGSNFNLQDHQINAIKAASKSNNKVFLNAFVSDTDFNKNSGQILRGLAAESNVELWKWFMKEHKLPQEIYDGELDILIGWADKTKNTYTEFLKLYLDHGITSSKQKTQHGFLANGESDEAFDIRVENAFKIACSESDPRALIEVQCMNSLIFGPKIRSILVENSAMNLIDEMVKLDRIDLGKVCIRALELKRLGVLTYIFCGSKVTSITHRAVISSLNLLLEMAVDSGDPETMTWITTQIKGLINPSDEKPIEHWDAVQFAIKSVNESISKIIGKWLDGTLVLSNEQIDSILVCYRKKIDISRFIEKAIMTKDHSKAIYLLSHLKCLDLNQESMDFFRTLPYDLLILAMKFEDQIVFDKLLSIIQPKWFGNRNPHQIFLESLDKPFEMIKKYYSNPIVSSHILPLIWFDLACEIANGRMKYPGNKNDMVEFLLNEVILPQKPTPSSDPDFKTKWDYILKGHVKFPRRQTGEDETETVLVSNNRWYSSTSDYILSNGWMTEFPGFVTFLKERLMELNGSDLKIPQ